LILLPVCSCALVSHFLYSARRSLFLCKKTTSVQREKSSVNVPKKGAPPREVYDIGPPRSECTSWSRLVTRTPPALGKKVIAALPYRHGSQMSLSTMEVHVSPSSSLF